ncbi:hypothetical protein K458DRAFT_291181 [Lentithecium fluviatile CBS 122367]|uniref:Uncharacterized protein n=1 Tax=Lentithecium fluviatile CBS 122367 TaxID=1168545 RepID=A0A6G1JHK4_9PLEO|nr:hypothetical protein K458DRAFT_291181 [Lentithecium fluviatile CBS 122367]
MLPPVGPSVLQRNPNFEILYKDLCTRKLNPDGSTRDTKKQRMHDQIRRNLQLSLQTLHTTHLLISTLSDLPSKTTSLPPDLHPLIDLAIAQLSGNVPPADREVLAADTDLFLTHIPTIATALSTQLTVATSILCTIADPEDPPSISALSARAEQLRNATTLDLPSSLATAKITLANTTHTLLTQHLSLLTTSIRILEQTQHGSLARHQKSKAEVLNARATVLGLQARIHTHTHPPPPPFLAALKNFKASQGSTEKGLKDREALARRTLELYERAGEKGMRDLARRKVWILEEMGTMEGEIKGLE